ncbi:MAG TPA: hypothetical protein VGQ15_09980 [Gaiellaceae bacterium]|nr:hypothetical protein [Gaiellaceae bacterium]
MEREVQHEPQVLEGDDLIPHQPADRTELDPAPAPTDRARKALLLALLLILAFVAVLVVWLLVS